MEPGYAFRSYLTIVFSLTNLLWNTVAYGSILSSVEFSSMFPLMGKVLFILHAAKASAIRKTTYDSEMFAEIIRAIIMAALQFSESDYQTTVDCCSTVLINQALEEEEEEEAIWEKDTLNAGCLFYVDDSVRIIRFYLLFRRIQDNLQYNRRQCLFDLRLTTHVVTHYLIISSSERKSKIFGLNCDLQLPAFPLD